MPFLLPPRLMRQPTVKFYAATLSLPHTTDSDILTANTTTHFYTTQSRKLQALLDTVLAEAQTHTIRSDPQTRLDYLELSGMLCEMLQEANFYAGLGTEELKGREAFVRFFLAKVDTVRGTIADWDAKSRRMRTVRSSRKRGRRSVDLHCEAMAMAKRRRDDGVDADVGFGGERMVGLSMGSNAVSPASSAGGYNALPPQPWPSMEVDSQPETSAPWWTQPYCD